ncbi:MAG: RNA 2',3'-cyclic phosphodiesterase [bacterium]
MKELIRAFIALDLPFEVKNYITISLFDLKKHFKYEDIKWVNTENLHITFAFFKQIDKSLVINKFNQLDFKNLNNNIIISINEKVDNFNYKVLYLKPDNYDFFLNIYNEILKEFTGYMDIKEKFIPHLTIARIRNRLNPNEINILQNFRLPIIQFKPKEIALFQSILMPNGPIYYKLKSIYL